MGHGIARDVGILMGDEVGCGVLVVDLEGVVESVVVGEGQLTGVRLQPEICHWRTIYFGWRRRGRREGR